FTYDELGRVKLQKWDIGTLHFEVEGHWDDFGRLARISYPETPGRPRFEVVYEYTDFGHVRSVKDARTHESLWSVSEANARGQIRMETFANGLHSTRKFHEFKGTLTGITTSDRGDSKLAQALRYDFDENGNLNQRIDDQTQFKEEFHYDFAD